ncbi:hypothetical protein ACRXCV_11995 [Halobacteriovorax sp. GFR7]|uniref:hypothetical protein n=1 Tax=unclassified Halobacteriovorax TaxID=2639665 RepID=UPI003D99BB8E
MKLLKNEKGGAALAFIIFASVAAAYLTMNLNKVLDVVSKKKKDGRINAEIDTFTRGLISYTSHALKNRWCMDESWERSEKCSGDMQEVISNKRNLERLLWSSTAVTAIKKAYQNEYNREIGFEPALNEVQTTVKIKSLEELSKSHPINLSLSHTLRNCMDEVLIKLNRAENSALYTSGDDRYIEIYVEAKMKEDSQCDDYDKKPYARSLVGLFPRTLNQFAIIKGGDFDITKYTGSKSAKGLNIHAPIYVDNDLIIPTSSYAPVGLYSNIHLGRGSIRGSSGDFEPPSHGGVNDQLYSTYPMVKTIKRGVIFEDEVDEGIAVLFGNAYYSDTALAKKCDIWRKLEENLSETRDSRLFGRKASSGFSVGLSKTDLPISNEFKEYGYPSAMVSEKEGYIKILDNIKNTVSYIDPGNSEKPIMKMDVTVPANGEYAELLLARDSQFKINLNSNVNFIKSKDVLNQETVSEEQFDDTYKENEFEGIVRRLKDKCNSLNSKNSNVRSSECSLVSAGFNTDKSGSCSSEYSKKPARKATCDFRVSEIERLSDDYKKLKDESLKEIDDFLKNQPSIDLKMSASTTNITNFNLGITNKDQLNTDVYKNISQIKLSITAFDFAIENSSNPISGARRSEPQKPGPNELGNPNIINIVFLRDQFGKFSGVKYTNAEDRELGGWTLLKKDNSSNEPPRKPEEGFFDKLSDEIYIPEDGLTLSESKELKDKCSGIPDNDNFSWDISFTKNTLHSWMYDVGGNGVTLTDVMEMQDLYRFNQGNMFPGDAGGIPNQSVTKKCIIPSEVDFIFGFYACQDLVVEARSTPLTFVGTLLVNKLEIPSGALNAGVDFYNIWHPAAIEKLREYKWLARRRDNGDILNCDNSITVWDKNISRQEQYDLRTCSPIHFVLEGPNNYNWTTVDPEIGLPDDGGLVTRSKIPNRYRRFNIQTYWVETGSL